MISNKQNKSIQKYKSNNTNSLHKCVYMASQSLPVCTVCVCVGGAAGPLSVWPMRVVHSTAWAWRHSLLEYQLARVHTIPMKDDVQLVTQTTFNGYIWNILKACETLPHRKRRKQKRKGEKKKIPNYFLFFLPLPLPLLGTKQEKSMSLSDMSE